LFDILAPIRSQEYVQYHQTRLETWVGKAGNRLHFMRGVQNFGSKIKVIKNRCFIIDSFARILFIASDLVIDVRVDTLCYHQNGMSRTVHLDMPGCC